MEGKRPPKLMGRMLDAWMFEIHGDGRTLVESAEISRVVYAAPPPKKALAEEERVQ